MFKRHLSDLVQAQQTSVGRLDLAGVPLFPGPGECSLGIAKELTSNEVSRYSAAIDRYERTRGGRTRAVNSAGKQLLADAGLSFDKNWGAGGRHFAGALFHLLHSGAVSKNLVEIEEPLCQWPF